VRNVGVECGKTFRKPTLNDDISKLAVELAHVHDHIRGEEQASSGLRNAKTSLEYSIYVVEVVDPKVRNDKSADESGRSMFAASS